MSLPAFAAPGGGASASEIADWSSDPERPTLPPMPSLVDVASKGTLEPGSVRLLAWRLSTAACVMNSLSVFLTLGACASPWFVTAFGSCVVGYGLSVYGRLTVCEGAGISAYPSAFPSGTTTPFIATLGFSQFLMVCALFCTIMGAVSSGLLANAIIRSLPPKRVGTAFLSNAFTASAFTLGALGTVIATGRFLLTFRQSPELTYTYSAGHGSADAMIVFTCASMVCTTIAKVRLRLAADDAPLQAEKEAYAKMLGAEVDGNIFHRYCC